MPDGDGSIEGPIGPPSGSGNSAGPHDSHDVNDSHGAQPPAGSGNSPAPKDPYRPSPLLPGLSMPASLNGVDVVVTEIDYPVSAQELETVVIGLASCPNVIWTVGTAAITGPWILAYTALSAVGCMISIYRTSGFYWQSHPKVPSNTPCPKKLRRLLARPNQFSDEANRVRHIPMKGDDEVAIWVRLMVENALAC